MPQETGKYIFEWLDRDEEPICLEISIVPIDVKNVEDAEDIVEQPCTT